MMIAMSSGNLCDRCGRTVDDKQKEIPFKSITDEIIAIQRNVRKVDAEIQRLTAHRVALQRRLNAIAAITVVLPVEIIALIFQHASPPLDFDGSCEPASSESGNGGNSVSKDGGLTYPTLPFRLAAVCSQWRAIALSTPYLWTSVAFSLYQSRSTSNAAALETFFNRAGSCPLNVALTFPTSDEGRDHLEGETVPSLDVLRVFLAHPTRWGQLKIDGLPPEWIPPLRAAAHHTPELRQLWLCPYDNSREQQMVDMFTSAPLLRSVTLDNTFLSAIALPWSNITRLKVSWVSIDECAEMLRRCPALRECEFSRILSNAEFHTLPMAESSDPPLVLPYLHTLNWAYAGDAWEFHLFERIHFPALRFLRMKLRYDAPHFGTIERVLGGMLSRTSKDVERVDLDLGCTWASAWKILQGASKVKELRIVEEHDSEFARGMVGALTDTVVAKSATTGGGAGDEGTAISGVAQGNIDDDKGHVLQEIFLPQLRVLEFQGTSPIDFSFPIFVAEQLRKRWEMDASVRDLAGSRSSRMYGKNYGTIDRCRLEKVDFAFSADVILDEISDRNTGADILKELIELGMGVRVVSGVDSRSWV